MSESSLRLTDVSAPEQRSGCGCGCGNAVTSTAAEDLPTPAGPAAPVGAAVSTSLQVAGMTCGHCVAAVTEELTAGVPGVQQVQVDLATGQVTVTSDRPLDRDAVNTAVQEAGYELVAADAR